VRTLARGRRVLNLFGYTGGFSIYAGGGRRARDVDRRRRGAGHRGGAPQLRAQRAADRRRALRQRRRVRVPRARGARGERFDLVISDPPSFAPSRRALATGLRAYRRLHRLCAAVTAPGGTLCAASCSSHVDRAGVPRHGARRRARGGPRFELHELRGAAADHPVTAKFPEGDYLKFAVGAL
jgi:23S rRNA (cytosine1962-C5)-methyltransferase